MKKITCFLAICLFSAPCFGQDRTESSHSATIYPLGVEYGYEISVARKWTVRPHAGANALIGWSRDMLIVDDQNVESGSDWFYLVRGAFGADVRYYYNLSQRMEQGRPTALNSGNFFGIDLLYFTEPFAEHDVTSDGYFQFSPRWGMRRVYRQKWLLEIDLGANIATTGDDWGWSPRLGIRWGFVF